MAENVTQDGTSGEGEGAGEATPAPASGGTGTVTPPADAFAEERARLQAEARDWQGKFDRLQAETGKQTPPPASPTPSGEFLTKEDFRAELRRQRELDSAVGALREQFPLAKSVLARVDEFDSVEALKVAAENAQREMEAVLAPAVEAAKQAAIEPYVKRFGALQGDPTGSKTGEGDGLPTLEEIERMTLDEQTALEKAHPGHIARVHQEALSRLV